MSATIERNSSHHDRAGLSVPRFSLCVVCLRLTNFLPSTFLLSHPEGIERRLVDCRSRGKSLVGLVGTERLAGYRPEQSIHVTPVVAHLLQLVMHVSDHLTRRVTTVTRIHRTVDAIIL